MGFAGLLRTIQMLIAMATRTTAAITMVRMGGLLRSVDAGFVGVTSIVCSASESFREAKSRSAPHLQPKGKWLRQMGRAHALLDAVDVVRDAPKFDDAIFQVGDGEAGAGIGIARLTDGAGI